MADMHNLAGRFIVKLDGATHRGLTAEQVLALLDDRGVDVHEVQRIHRVYGDGRLELVGVSPDSLKRRDALLFFRADVGAARRDYDALLELGRRTPPPCKIEIELAHVNHPTPAHVVVLRFSAACSESVGQWLVAANISPGDRAVGSPDALSAHEANRPQVVLRCILEPV